eukprot:633542-Rhodomonas_salina.1
MQVFVFDFGVYPAKSDTKTHALRTISQFSARNHCEIKHHAPKNLCQACAFLYRGGMLLLATFGAFLSTSGTVCQLPVAVEDVSGPHREAHGRCEPEHSFHKSGNNFACPKSNASNRVPGTDLQSVALRL